MNSLRGKTAIVGIGEVPTRRQYENRTMYGLCADASKLAIEDRVSALDMLYLE